LSYLFRTKAPFKWEGQYQPLVIGRLHSQKADLSFSAGK
jgi:hypothetical protein